MCMFCAALPMVAGATAVAQGEQRKRIQAIEARQHQLDSEITPIDTTPSKPQRIWLTPRRITQMGAVAFVLVLFGSGFYHTHFPG